MDKNISVTSLLNFMSSKLTVNTVDSVEEKTISCEAFYRVRPHELIEFISDEINKTEKVFRISGKDLIGVLHREKTGDE